MDRVKEEKGAGRKRKREKIAFS